MYQEIKSLTNKRSARTATIKDKNGELIEEKEIANRWVEYCSEMYKKNPNENEPITERHTSTTGKEESLPPLRSEIEDAIKKLHPRKSPGVDGIHAEMIKAAGDEAIDLLSYTVKKDMGDRRMAFGMEDYNILTITQKRRPARMLKPLNNCSDQPPEQKTFK